MVDNNDAISCVGIGDYCTYNVHNIIKWYDLRKLRKEKLKKIKIKSLYL
jgi:hypothetical protein